MRSRSVWLAAVFAALLLMAAVLPAAYAWENEQQALNHVREEGTAATVLLQKLEKQADGTPTDQALPNAVFRLYRADGTPIGDPLTTDSHGQLLAELPVGSYYWKEMTPPEGYTFDRDKNGDDIREYPFTVRKAGEALRLTAYNLRSACEPIRVTLPDICKETEGADAPQERFTFVLRGSLGAPVPEDASGRVWRVSRLGAGTVSPGSLSFTEAGEYTYTVYEAAGDEPGWTYDEAEYTLTFRVTEKAGKLSCDGCTIEKGGREADEVVFTNRYEAIDLDETLTVSGQKSWSHRGNPAANRPDHIILRVYGDGKLVKQRRVTAETDWSYAFELPRYNEKGHEIRYTVDEETVEGYSKQISGYDILNTYVGAATTPTDTAPSDTPARPSKPPKTGDDFALSFWIAMSAVGLAGFAVMLALLLKSRRREREHPHTDGGEQNGSGGELPDGRRSRRDITERIP